MSFPSVYEPGKYEADIYSLWEQGRVFQADPDSGKERFSISMPPPNETGTLHVGHALFLTLQDILARHARQAGKDVLWLPGTDHAALATNAIIEKQLAEQGTDKHQIGREEFIRTVKEFVGNSRNTINSQIRAMGASCDWSRARYTLDDALNRCVNEVFVKMYHDGLIYRGHRIVNWDPKLETTVSDDEVEHKEEKGKFYTLQYGPFQIGTARPETKFGDKYVVMHPDDERYKQYKHGDTFEAKWINGPVTATVIKDEAVDPAFGTGVMTITPWHDATDFEIAERHGLEREPIIGFDGQLLPVAGEFAGMKIEDARPKIVEKLQQKGLVVSIDEDYLHNVATNSRGGGLIEPQIKLQWFVDVNRPVVDWKGQLRSLKEVMRAVVEDGDIKIIPKRFEKIYFHWIDNLRDWNISRQIWWGHRIPIWYKGDEIYTGVRPPEGQGWEQDPDTLDTWFSSALWTWSTLVKPELADDFSLSLEDMLKLSPDFKAYHPTSVMETGWDILFFWVARMILTTTYIMSATKQPEDKRIPFKTVYLHGLVRAEGGKKMSKSDPSTIIDPLNLGAEFGTDALRLSLVDGVSPGNPQTMTDAKLTNNRNFCNKLWNIARYIQMTAVDAAAEAQPASLADHWILNKLSILTGEIDSNIDNFRFSEAYQALYHFIWDDLADWYIEASKTEPNRGLLKYALEHSLVLLHPFAPFITEAIWRQLGHEDLLAAQQLSPLPPADKAAADKFERLQQIVIEARHLIAVTGVKKPVMTYRESSLLAEQADLVARLGRLGSISQSDDSDGLKLIRTDEAVWLEIDKQAAQAYADKLEHQRQQRQAAIDRLKQRLDNKSYVDNAPKQLIEETRQNLATEETLLKQVEEEINSLQASRN